MSPSGPRARRACRASSVRLLLLVVTTLVLSAAVPANASAEHGGRGIGSLLACDRPVTPPRCVSVGDNRWHFVYIDPSVPAEIAESVRNAMRNAYAPTSLAMFLQTRLTPYTDVIVYAADHGQNGAAGWTYCPPEAPQGTNRHGDRWCRHQELHFNLNARYAVFFADAASRDHLACHELGHTLGLRHWGNPPESDGPVAATCMNADTPNGPTDLHAFDRDHIADYYTAPPRRLLLRLSPF